MKISYKFKPLYNASYRYAIISGGRGGAKSFSTQTFIRDLSYEEGHKIAVTRYTMTSAKKSIIPEFTSKLEIDKSPYSKDKMLSDFELVDNTFTNIRSNSEVSFMGLKTSSGIQTASLKSIEGLTTWVMEEAEELIDDGTDTEECTFDKIDNSIRTINRTLRTILLWNPTNTDSFVYKRFFKEAGVDITFNGIKNGVLYIYVNYEDNLENLHPSFIDKANQVKEVNPARYSHIYMGIPTEQNANALWNKNTMISPFRVLTVPDLKRIVVGVDPSMTNTGKQDECGIVVVGLGYDNNFYVLEDYSAQLSTLDWAKTVISAYKEYEADIIVAEVNQGYDLVKMNIHNIMSNAPVKEVRAKKGKITRAEPVSALYEEGRVHHAKHFKELEFELCNYTGDPKQDSPDRMDALVYALTELAFKDAKPIFFA